MTPLDLSALDDPIEPVILTTHQTTETGEYVLGLDGQPIITKKEHAVRPVDAVGFQYLQALKENLDDITVYQKIVKRLVPTASKEELDQMTGTQMMVLIGHAQRRLTNILGMLGKDLAQTVEVQNPQA